MEESQLGPQLAASPSSSRSSSGWFGLLQESLLLEESLLQESLLDHIDNDPESLHTFNVGTSTSSRRIDGSDHDNGTCDPCVLFSSSHGCAKGQSCRYCHLTPHAPAEKIKAAHRPRKQTRDKFKTSVQEMLQAHKGRVEEIHHELQAEARKSPYVRKLLQGYLDEDGADSEIFAPPGLFAPSPPPGLALPAGLPVPLTQDQEMPLPYAPVGPLRILSSMSC
ncbi:unnamed protein product [Effrenium voratum]|uniref:C3H1-type domain-containing protein n=1 Tax=Effrenium voratum TaxID=2562239 RepID=A0AA36IGQ3_9DINO|nr:unnamed protein product [Effrenium voratum]